MGRGYISGDCDRAQVRGFLLWVHHDVCDWARHGRAERPFMGSSIHIGLSKTAERAVLLETRAK